MRRHRRAPFATSSRYGSHSFDDRNQAIYAKLPSDVIAPVRGRAGRRVARAAGGRAVVRKAVILAGGLGTRLMEETEARPKPMVEIGGRPILWHIMKIYSAQ